MCVWGVVVSVYLLCFCECTQSFPLQCHKLLSRRAGWTSQNKPCDDMLRFQCHPFSHRSQNESKLSMHVKDSMRENSIVDVAATWCVQQGAVA